MSDTVLIADTPEALVQTAKLLAIYQGKPFYIAQTPSGKYKITSEKPHSGAWKREKFEWIKTILPSEKH